MSKKPLIGVTFDSLETGDFARSPWYGLRQNYCSSVAEVGGIPLPLIHDLTLIDSYLSSIEGLILTGGDYDIDPTFYGMPTRHPTVKTKPRRTTFEMTILAGALERNLPILGICGGEQLINVKLGGTLIQHIPDEITAPLPHEKFKPSSEASHTVQVMKGTHLHQIVKNDGLSVNSTHHQAVKELGQGVVINAVASDGVIEGIEVPAYRFCLGVQWHPEFFVSPQDKVIFEAFLEAVCG